MAIGIMLRGIFVVADRPADVTITDYEVSNWETFWFRWTYNSSTPDDKSTYNGWFRNRYYRLYNYADYISLTAFLLEEI